MAIAAPSYRLDRAVDETRDHVLGPTDAGITLVEYGSYACPHCRAANERIAGLRDRFGERLRYVFRHKPLSGSPLALPAAELAERATTPREFWAAHNKLMTRSTTLTADDLRAIAGELGVDDAGGDHASAEAMRARARVLEDTQSASASGVRVTPTFFINGRRYDGPWDEGSFSDAMLGSLGYRLRAAALEFASWAPSAGMLLLLASVLAVVLMNSPWGAAFERFWEQPVGFQFGDAGIQHSLRHWITSGLLSIFFLVVGLEVKREFTVGHLAGRRSAALPIAAAIGGMVAPALLYLAVIGGGAWAHGWGVPMATDTAFAIALIAMLGSRVPLELRVFLTAATIVDDIGAIVVVAIFYSGELDGAYLAAAAGIVVALALLNHARVYAIFPYMLLGTVLWACVEASGIHATLAGVVLAMFIPTRQPPSYNSLMAQADAILAAEARHGGEVLRHGPSEPVLRALDAIHDRMESPASRTLRNFGPRSSYVVLPIFAFANAGVVVNADVLEGREPLMLALLAGLVVGKPVGMFLVSLLAVRLGIAIKPQGYSWQQLAGAGALSGIGFTMSLFIAGQAFPDPADFAASKLAVFAASLVAALIGTAFLLFAKSPEPDGGLPRPA
ncbi:MAG: Na+/H+ antiporter NhaA [Steroidobacteraceae bacterium]